MKWRGMRPAPRRALATGVLAERAAGANKYRAQKAECAAGHVHDSKREARRCTALGLLERAGAISNLRRQVAYELAPGGVPIVIRSDGYPNGRRVKITFDFVYDEAGVTVADDTKGVEVRDFPLRLALFQACYPEIRTRLNGVDTPGGWPR